MRITRIDLEGQKEGHYATATRKQDADHIEVTILTPDNPNGLEHHVLADCEDDIYSMAECLQFTLDGHEGSGSEVQDYNCVLQLLSDI